MSTDQKLTISREFYLKDANTVAPELLGKLLIHRSDKGITSGIIVETEAYVGPNDKAAHSYNNRRTRRTRIQFGTGGYAYIYNIYGMHTCFNIVVNIENKPEVVLIRALQPVEGIDLMRQRRGIEKKLELCNGPGKLCIAMGISKDYYGCDLCGAELYLEPCLEVGDNDIMISPRINIDYAEEYTGYLWRYFIKKNLYISKVERRFRNQEQEYRKYN